MTKMLCLTLTIAMAMAAAIAEAQQPDKVYHYGKFAIFRASPVTSKTCIPVLALSTI